MLRITIEMLPGGDATRAWVMAAGVIVNDGNGSLTVGHYHYGFSGQARRPGHDPGIAVSGTLRDFNRRRYNCWELLRRCLEQGDEQLVTRDGTAWEDSAV